MNLSDYVQDVSKRFAAGNAREHTYRGTLQNLLEATFPNIQTTNEPARIDCGAPDYVLTRKNLPVGYIEAKDIGVDLNKTEKTEQINRYLDATPSNLILTDYLEFRFYRNKEKIETIRIGEVDGKTIRPVTENFDRLLDLLNAFTTFEGPAIKSAKKLAEMMAGNARLMRNVFKATLEAEDESTLKDQMKAFKAILMHDLDEEQFADIYAQTITYGLFTARLHDETPETFSRGESLTLIPASNPFLRQLFTYVAGADLDPRVIWIVDALCEVYRATDLKAILKDFGTSTGQNDPILHFYETFLGVYDKSLRKARGVWYTPEPVVQFIVRAIDDVLKDHFGLSGGIACTDKIDIEVDSDRINKRTGKREKDKKSVHKVQLLDVATGTGTFMAEAIKKIYERFKGQEGLWSRYVDEHLLPRLHGFELLMASYAMCHMKLDLLLQETGYKPSNPAKPPRVSVYLTNSLEEHHPDADTLFATWLSHEANAASRIKRDMPIMVAFGNPPYSVSSSNKGEWIQSLISDYKKNLNERKINLDDDYIKFIRYAEHYVEKTGYGIVAMITNNSFLDGATHRQMRKHLLETFDTIYIYDLHGSSKKKEKSPDGSKDENVFDIQQGVSISIFIKTHQNNKKPADVYHADAYGVREDKYYRLKTDNLNSTPFKKLKPIEPYFFFAPKDFGASDEYEKGFAITELFIEQNTGIQTKRDALCLQNSKEEIEIVREDFLNLSAETLKAKYNLVDDNRDWKIHWAKEDVKKESSTLTQVSYRPFDNKWTLYSGASKGFIGYPRGSTMDHMLKGRNLALLTARQNKSGQVDHFFVTDKISEMKCAERTIQSYHFPLYLYQKNMDEIEVKVPNLNPQIFTKIKSIVPDLTPENLFDYIYAAVHSPEYRQRYAEFLKIDFPRIPYPLDSKKFHAVAAIGAELRALHLLESPRINNFITTYSVDGNHAVDKPIYKDGNVYINADQYFGNVPETAWNFCIGGYQPAQKWLKDRRGRNLSIDDIMHYQHIIVALVETDRIMQDIDKISFLPKVN